MCWKCKPGQLRSYNWHVIDAAVEEQRFQDVMAEGPAAAFLFFKIFKLVLLTAAVFAVLGVYYDVFSDPTLHETLGDPPSDGHRP